MHLPVGKCTIFSAEKGKAESCGVALYKGGGWDLNCTAGSTVWEEGGYFERDLEHNGQVRFNGPVCYVDEIVVQMRIKEYN